MKAMQYIIAIVGVIVVLIGSSVLNGYALSILWSWFVVTAFGATALNIPQAIGIAMTVRLVTYQHDAKTKEVDPYSALLYGLSFPLVCLAVGWIVKQFL